MAPDLPMTVRLVSALFLFLHAKPAHRSRLLTEACGFCRVTFDGDTLAPFTKRKDG